MTAVLLDPGTDAGARAVRRAAIGALIAVVALIVYGSLYPFNFRGAGRLMLGWPRHVTRDDVVINFLLYLPAGVCAFLAAPAATRAWLRVLIVTVGAILLSMAIEIAQAFDAGRHSSLLDVEMNVAGAAAGALAAPALRSQRFWAVIPVASRAAGGAFVLALWLAWRLSPFVADLNGGDIAKAMSGLAQSWRPDARSIFTFTVLWLAMLHVVEALAAGKRVIARGLAMLIVVAALRAVMLGKAVTMQEAYGFAAAATLWASGLRQPWVAAGLLGLHLVQQGLAPSGPWAPRPFNWLPFRYLIRGASEYAMSVMLGQLFSTALILWLLLRSGLGFAGALSLSLGISVGIEWGQTGVRGRWPDITEPVIVIVIAIAMMRIDIIARAFEDERAARRRYGDA